MLDDGRSPGMKSKKCPIMVGAILPGACISPDENRLYTVTPGRRNEAKPGQAGPDTAKQNKAREARTTAPDSKAKKDWIKANTVFIGLKLNKNTDRDILSALDGKPKQTEIKRLIRKALTNIDK